MDDMKLLELKQLLNQLDTMEKPKQPKYVPGMPMEMWSQVQLDYQASVEAYHKSRKQLEDTEICTSLSEKPKVGWRG